MDTSCTPAELIGHTHQRAALAALVTEDRLPSSLLFSGQAGVGKHLVARELAAQLLCLAPHPAPQGGCGECQACRLLRIGNHPDLRIMRWGDEGASVDDLRATLEKLSLRPFLGKRKVNILNDVDGISTVGANILLKSLEEPRPESFFILIAATPSRLPQTVLSRCQRWFFDRLSVDELSAVLTRRGASEHELSLIPFADGSCAALDALRAKGEMGHDTKAALDAAWRGDTAAVTKAAQDWGSDKTTVRERLVFLRTAIRERLLSSGSDQSAACVWAHGLQNAIDAEYLIVDRHVNPTLTFLAVLQSCSRDHAAAYQITPNVSAPLFERVINQ